ncbi:MAG: hypothetical protein ACLUYS_07400 [Allobaculum sp.]|uniref:hypothetical protein n=1 Tax=Allobaculum sp. TaxID=1872463 RepID=UPI00399BB5DD
MKQIRSVFLIALPALTVLGVTGVRLFRYFAAERIMENGGSMNPDTVDGSETPRYWMAIIHTPIMRCCFR